MGADLPGRDAAAQGPAQDGRKRSSQKKNEWFFVNPYLIVGIVGASFCFAWFFSILLTPDFVHVGLDGNSPSLPHVAFALALLVAYLAIRCFSNALQRHRGVLLGVAMVCGLAGTVPGGGRFV